MQAVSTVLLLVKNKFSQSSS